MPVDLGANASLHQMVQAIVTVLAVINPVVCGSIFLTLTQTVDSRQKWRAAVKVALSILVILVVSALAGLKVLSIFGISLDVFRIVGGMICGRHQNFVDQPGMAQAIHHTRKHGFATQILEHLARQPSTPHARLNDGDYLQDSSANNTCSALLSQEEHGIDIRVLQVRQALFPHQLQIGEAIEITLRIVHFP